MAQIHRCGVCNREFGSEDEYIAHDCEVTGYTPDSPYHQDVLTGGAFSRQSEKARERGEQREE